MTSKKREKKNKKFSIYMKEKLVKLKTNWKVWISSFLFIVAISFIIIFPRNPAHSLFLRYISTLLTWPFIILILGLVLFFKFAGPISERIRTLLVKTPKGYEFGIYSQEEVRPFDEEKLKKFEKKLEEEKRIKEGFMVMFGFEKIIRNTYRSQYSLLKFLKERSAQLFDRVILFYSEYLSRGGDKNYTIARYAGFLIEYACFIKTDIKNGNYIMELTPRGHSFVDYCNFMGYSEKEFIPL